MNINKHFFNFLFFLTVFYQLSTYLLFYLFKKKKKKQKLWIQVE